MTLVEYIDLQCPYCRDFDTQTLPSLVSRYVRTGKLRIELRPIAFVGPDSVNGRAAVIAAARQDRMFHLTALLYHHQGAENTGWLDDEMVAGAAASIPLLEVKRLLAERDSPRIVDQSQRLDTQAQADNVTSTPTILVGRSGGPLHRVELSSPTDETSLADAINSALG